MYCNIYRLAMCVCGLVVLVSSQEAEQITDAPLINTNLCGDEPEIELTKSGDTSTMTVTLDPTKLNSVCQMRVTAPPTHVIYIKFIEASPNIKLNSTKPHPPCVMSIFLPENSRVPVWKGDPCSDNALTEVDLLTSDIKLIWNPPADATFTRGRKFVMTAVGQGQVCKEEGQHTCMKIGWDPMLCIADTLVCNGFENCPKSSTSSDEDDKICKKSFFAPASLEQLLVEFFKKRKPPELANNKWLSQKFEQKAQTTAKPRRKLYSWRELRDNVKSETTTSTTTEKPKKKATDSISQVLSKYGPWGYLMLGMLICGTVLMFCGLWECCFKRPKTDVEPPLTQTQPTTVLVINPHEDRPPNPPNYDDLDQPPSYSILFPNFKVDQNPSGSAQEADQTVSET